jgi:hypothetical protein
VRNPEQILEEQMEQIHSKTDLVDVNKVYEKIKFDQSQYRCLFDV